jgi:signal transduction histidine kinase
MREGAPGRVAGSIFPPISLRVRVRGAHPRVLCMVGGVGLYTVGRGTMRKLAIGALAIGIFVTTGAIRAADLSRARRETLEAAEARAANLAHILAAYVTEAFAVGDAALRQLALHSRRVGGPAGNVQAWAASLEEARVGIPGIGSISILDRDGIVRHSTRREIVGQSRQHDYIVRHALTTRGDSLVVGNPFRSLVPPYGMLIPFARRLTRADGTIEGAVVASFVPDETRGFFATVDVGDHGAMWIFHPDGVVLFREPSKTDHLGEDARQHPLFAAASQADVTGVLQSPVEPGGPVMLSAFYRAENPPLIVAVSLDRNEVLATWRRSARGAAATYAVVALTLVSVLMILFRQMDAKAAAEAATLQREQSARRAAEQTSALKDQFLMTVSHELRTPLTVISGWARMLLDGGLSDTRREAALKTIERNADAQTRLIEDLLDVSGVISGKLHLEMRIVSLSEVIHNAAESMRPAADAKHVQLLTSFDSSVGVILGDAGRLQQIVWNLLSNAVKFTPKGGRVELSVTRQGDEVEIVVADTGVGIAPQFMPHVFERFRQEDVGTKRRYSGLGLGLAIVRHLVELHGGTVVAESEGQGRGATFRVRLPAAPSATGTGMGRRESAHQASAFVHDPSTSTDVP